MRPKSSTSVKMSREIPLNLADWDEQCMQEFIKQNSSAFHVFASRYVEDKEAIDDFLQEAYIKLWTHRLSIGEVKSVRNYFFTLLHHVIIDNRTLFQSANETDNLENYLEISSNENFVDNLIEAESSRLIAEAIKSLSPQSREVILLSMEGNSLNEIAETLNVSINTVKTVKYRAIKQLSERLSKEDFMLLLFILSL